MVDVDFLGECADLDALLTRELDQQEPVKISPVPAPPPPVESPYRLLADSGREVVLTRTPFLIGRDSTCHLKAISPELSRQHATLSQRGGKLYVKDLGSTNGTKLDDRVIGTTEEELYPGCRLGFGPLRFTVLEPQPDHVGIQYVSMVHPGAHPRVHQVIGLLALPEVFLSGTVSASPRPVPELARPTRSAPLPTPAPAGIIPQVVPPSSPSPSREPPRPTPKPQDLEMDVWCPACNASNHFPVSKLDHILSCQSCESKFRLAASGPELLVNQPASKPKEKQRRAEKASVSSSLVKENQDKPKWGLRIAVAAAILLTATGGWFFRPSGERGLQPTTGMVLYDGKPLATGVVCFEPTAAPGMPARGHIGADGKFVLKTGDATGVVTGRSRVYVVVDRIARVPSKYSDPDSSELVIEVQPGKAEIGPIELSSRPQRRLPNL